MLSLGRHPLPEYIDSITSLNDRQIQESRVAQDFLDRVALAASARDAGQISNCGSSLDFVRWFRQMDFDTRQDLIDRVEYFHSDRPIEAEKEAGELFDSERLSLLKLVAAMALKGYKFDPNAQRNQATADIQHDAELLGLTLDQKTILKLSLIHI